MAQYNILTFTEQTNPESAFRAQQIQGESYVAAGFVYRSALDEYGRLLPELDRSRGDNVLYKVATAIKGNSDDQAALRIIGMSDSDSLEALPAYRNSRDALFQGVREELESRIEIHGKDSVREISGLSKTTQARDISSYELIRDILQEAVQNGTDEMWLIDFARPAFGAIRSSFGKRALTQIGSPVEVDVGDPRTSAELRLIPTAIYPCDVLEGLALDIDESSNNRTQRDRLVRTLKFLTDGIEATDLSSKVLEHTDTVRPSFSD